MEPVNTNQESRVRQPAVKFMTTECGVRKLERNDEQAIKEICRMSFGPIYQYFAIQSLSSPEDVLVCVKENVVAGFVKLTRNQIGNCVVGDILWLAVRPQFRKRSVASNLIIAGIDYFKKDGIHCVYVSTGRNNKAAISLFEKNGFIKRGFFDLFKLYGFRVFMFYSELWIAPTEVVLELKDPITSS